MTAMKDWDCRSWCLARAQALKPALKHWSVRPRAIVQPERCPDAWQHCRMRDVAPAETLRDRAFGKGESFIVDLGESVVGRIRLRLRPLGWNDSPCRLRITAAEMPHEAAANLETDFHGCLSRAWMQDETVNVDVLPGDCALPRRYSLRYLKVEVLCVAEKVAFEDIEVIAEAAERDLPPAPQELPEEWRLIHQTALRTLRNCMQDVMEDGPKRDRRLWLGDLRLQARANAVSFRRFDLIERSLLLLAAASDDDGRVPGCVFTEPHLRHGNDTVDYALLFAPTLEDLVSQTGDRDLAQRLYPLAARQHELFRSQLDDDGLVRHDAQGWIFIDWADFDRQTALQGLAVYSLRSLARLARLCGLHEQALRHQDEAERLAAALRRLRYDPERHLVLSGPRREVSWAGQIWPILGGVFTPDESRDILLAVARQPDAQRPVTPYMQHHLLEAYRHAGLHRQAADLLFAYWGAMVRHGADTFWEVFVPGDDFLSPYQDALLNSACHAWSCTPAAVMDDLWRPLHA